MAKLVTEGVAPGSIAVLTGLGLENSAVWKQRRYGNQVLWNGAVDDDVTILQADADTLRKQARVRKDVGKRESVVRRRDVLCPLTYEVVDRLPVKASNDGASKELTVLGVHHDPLALDWQEAKLQCTTVQLAIEELGMSVSKLRNKS